MRAILAASMYMAQTTICKEIDINSQADIFWYVGSVECEFVEVNWNGSDIIIFYDERAESKPNKGRLINGLDKALFGNLIIMGSGEELPAYFTAETIQKYITGVMFETSLNGGTNEIAR